MTPVRCTICHEIRDCSIIYLDTWYVNNDEGAVCEECESKPEIFRILRHKLEQEYKAMMDEKGEPC